MVLLKKYYLWHVFSKSKIKQKQMEEMNGFFLVNEINGRYMLLYCIILYEVIIIYIYMPEKNEGLKQ